MFRKIIFLLALVMILVYFSACTLKSSEPEELLRVCPEIGYSNQMPSPVQEEREIYYRVEGYEDMIPASRLDMEWIKENCPEIPISVAY